MAALRTSNFTRAAIAALVLVVLGLAAVPSVPSTEADQEGTFAGEWEFGLNLAPPSGFDPARCIGSLVEHEENVWLLLLTCEPFWHLDGDVEIDKGAATVSLRLPTIDSLGNARGEGALTLDERPCFEVELPRPNATLAIAGCKGRGDRGLVRCRADHITKALSVDSRDAALVLQHEAGLLSSRGCIYRGDVDVDGQIDSVDANLILQYAAARIESFPP